MSSLLNVGHMMLAVEAAEETTVVERVFALDAQLFMDAAIVACAVLFLFALLSYFVFNPARDLLRRRQERVLSELESAAREKEEALTYKLEYEDKLKNAEKSADEIISEGRKKANKRSEEIIAAANEEAARIRLRTEKEIELEKAKVKDDVKQEMVDVAKAMASKFISENMDADRQAALVDEVINEMGDKTWQ
ncbi:MAG: F0F1 ATP synthase subunit B [Clostridiales bacterium]|nr:F0F1 ATP synthase subunit B [Clostridiales bacterium]